VAVSREGSYQGTTLVVPQLANMIAALAAAKDRRTRVSDPHDSL